MAQRWLISVLLVSNFLSPSVVAQEPLTPWRNDPLFQQLAAALDAVPPSTSRLICSSPESSIRHSTTALHPC